jgi:BirA family biotin operon repressor/biotin-[acetyl-CoA-carboxylase] ligase
VAQSPLVGSASRTKISKVKKKVRSADPTRNASAKPKTSLSESAGFSLQKLRAGVAPYRLHWFPRLRSTNDHAAALRQRGKLFAPAIVLTGNQVAGRGRGGNKWWSSACILTVSFALPVYERLAAQELPLIAGMAVRNTAAMLTGERHIELKWPNDILHNGAKLAGILCERVDKIDLVGIGLNINLDPAEAPKILRDRITSLWSIAGKKLDPTEVLIALAAQLHQMMRKRMEQPFKVFVKEYEQHDALAGKQITVIPAGDETPITGRCEGIDETGRLLVRQRGTLHRVIAGHVIITPRK